LQPPFFSINAWNEEKQDSSDDEGDEDDEKQSAVR
jgi:hypothetical protein